MSRVDEAWDRYVKIFKDYSPCLVQNFHGMTVSNADKSAEADRHLRAALFDYLVVFDRDQRERFGDLVTAPLADVPEVDRDGPA